MNSALPRNPKRNMNWYNIKTVEYNIVKHLHSATLYSVSVNSATIKSATSKSATSNG